MRFSFILALAWVSICLYALRDSGYWALVLLPSMFIARIDGVAAGHISTMKVLHQRGMLHEEKIRAAMEAAANR